jgi:hypothetical protein
MPHAPYPASSSEFNIERISRFMIFDLRFPVFAFHGDKEKRGPAHPEGIVGGDDLIPVPVDVLNPLLFATYGELKQLRLMNGLNA